MNHTGSYPQDWPEIAYTVKQKNAWRCERCGHVHDRRTGHTLTVHHLDGNKSNCQDWNLAALCQRCHLHIQGVVRFHQFFMFEHSDWMKPHVEGFYRSTGVNQHERETRDQGRPALPGLRHRRRQE